MSDVASEPRAGIDHAAIMVMLMSEEDATGILSQLDPNELRQLATRMCALGEIDPHAISDAISGFSRSIDNGAISAHGRVDNVKRMLTSAVGDMKADSLIRQVAPDQKQEPSPTLAVLRWLDPGVIAEMLADEHPQAIAVLLLQLDTDTAAAALAALPRELHTPVLHRVARLGPVSRQAIAILEDTIEGMIERRHGSVPLTMGGVKEAAEIINRAHRSVEKEVMPKISKIDKALHQQLEHEMFKFEHLFVLDARQIGTLLREIENETLINSLRGLDPDDREIFYGAMSTRAADGLRDEIETMGRIKRAEVDAAQREVIAIAKRLIADGELIMGEADDDYV
ncbi:FliG C-terminal domain-containing protein [Citromicrobium bathyomarinum]|uniref:flagellar motor switch protein FliG n=1 Tax=Sphingomonadales TaxID=204457 RepID=UPI000225EDF8|nr:FliG C-terminal domain-containing protein [Citromicrobium sp. JLT1363]MBO81535.1 flagellar motor switch protein FliG [Citromicrobium sp.]|tara:strand:- start:45 stop:1064 length:1020 start_codon:yes stop_codon:yes gene_type:complete